MQSTVCSRVVKNTLSEQSPADEILRSLAVRPIAIRRIAGQTWKDIENTFIRQEPKTKNSLEDSMTKLIGLGAISECDDAEEWIDTVTQQIATQGNIGDDKEKTDELREKVRTVITGKLAKRSVFWSRDIGGYLGAR